MAAAAKRRLTFSFDSSGWLYVYHLGAAHYIQTQLIPHLPEDELSFSGSSGGALVACALCTGISIEELARFIIDRQPECRFNPWRMLPCVESAMEHFLPEDAAPMAEGRLRVLLTRVQLGWMVPLLWPEVISRFGSRAELAQVLRASCHIPVLGGLLPFRIDGDEAEPGGKGGKVKGGARYCDGLFWPSVLWSWRAFNASDTLLKVSGLGWPTAHVGPPVPMPLQWVVLPPSQRMLWRLFALGYHDTARFWSDTHGRSVAADHCGGCGSTADVAAAAAAAAVVATATAAAAADPTVPQPWSLPPEAMAPPSCFWMLVSLAAGWLQVCE